MSDKKINLTEDYFWEESYNSEKRSILPFDNKDWRNFAGIQCIEKIKKIGLSGKKIIEIGGGDAQILCHLAANYPNSSFSVLDYSPSGCALAKERANREKVKVDVFLGDVFSPLEHLKSNYDIVISFGLVEHFYNLSDIILAKKFFLKKGGIMFTLIPNMASPIYRYFCGRWSNDVLKKHILHDVGSLIKGHEKAGLVIEEAGYLASVEFGMLSMAVMNMGKNRKLEFLLYLWLTRLSKAIHFLEYLGVKLPSSSLFSPYIYVIGRC